MKKLKILILIVCLSVLLSDDKLDFKDFKLPVEINMTNIIPKNLNDELARPITDHEIEEIKKNAADYVPEPVSENDIIIFETTIGTFKGKFFNDKAPNHCYNFKKLANSGFYDGNKFHRVIPNFMIQGGDILSRDGRKDNDGTGNPGWTINSEFSDVEHKKGSISMHRIKSDIHSAGSQFFICLSRQQKLDNNYTIIGEVVESIDILDIINNIPSQSRQAFKMLKNSIPENEKSQIWVELIYNAETYFVKIPENQNEESFKQVILERLENHSKPSIPVRIKKIRVIENN